MVDAINSIQAKDNPFLSKVNNKQNQTSNIQKPDKQENPLFQLKNNNNPKPDSQNLTHPDQISNEKEKILKQTEMIQNIIPTI